ncbi:MULTISPECIES: DNA-packaging protein [unclassified Sphingobium]|jgi:phage terminase large subunit-like protein|uniref:DNA-packaging protein n=1 Tax=unclassified Sphingobium TaxID=2611147 RepID=UPI0007F38759|nr:MULTISPECIES: terminase family protein [unclassified Sphingobium]OAN53540.1 ATP-binding protein [Sphingobium sp. TCM1]WIW87254.1 terminase family protein [Sphingobium sp. V4]
MLSDREWLAGEDRTAWARLRARLTQAAAERLEREWAYLARPGQLPPAGDWRIWLMMAGRGFGKTRAGAEWVRAIAEGDPAARIALVGATLGEARSVMVEGASGLLSVAPWWARPVYAPALRKLTWPNGAVAMLFGAAEPESLRGPQFSHGWADEIAKWAGGEAAWHNLMMGMRLGDAPRVLATTTPRPVPLVRALAARDGTDVVVTRGRTADNAANLAPGFVDAMAASYGGTRLGRQELDGELIEEVEGALWTRDLIERCRVAHVPGMLGRVVVAVDPPASAGGDACGIIVAGTGGDGRAYVIADASVSGERPEGWARAVAAAAMVHGADRVVAEANNGGAMVESVLRAAEETMPVRLVHASRGKAARAEPVAALYEAGRVAHRGAFPELEDQMCGLLAGGAYVGPGRSPDRADALVWALTDLMLGKRGEARVRGM